MEPGALEAQLWEALQGEDDTRVGTLLCLGADPNLLLSGGSTAIHLAAGMERKSGALCLARILQYGGDPNVRSVEGLTPLHVAASWGCSTCLRLLLREGGNPRLEDQDRNTALDLALSHGNETCVQILQDSLEEMEEEQNSWMSHRRAESFLSTVAEDTSDEGEGPGVYAIPLGRTPESQRFHPSGPHSAFFPSLVSAFKRCSITENSPEESCFPEDVRLSCSFLTEYSWQDTTLPDQPGLLPPPCSHPVPSIRKQPPGWLMEETKPAFHRLEAHVGVNQAPLAENTASEGCNSTSDHNDSSLSRSMSPPNGANPEGLSTVRSKPPPLACIDGPHWKADPFSDSQEADLTLDLTQYCSFLHPGLVVKPSSHQGLDATSPDNVYLFSRVSPLTTLDFEKTVVGLDFLPSQEPDGCSEKLLGSESTNISQYASCASECYLSTMDTSGHNRSQKSGEKSGSFVEIPGVVGTVKVPPNGSENVGRLQSGSRIRETFRRRCSGKLHLESVEAISPSHFSWDQDLIETPSKKEGSCILDPLPLQEPLSPTRPPAENRASSPEDSPRLIGRPFVAQEPGVGGGTGSPKMCPVLGEEENQVGKQDWGLSLRPSEAAGFTPSCSSTILVEANEAAGFSPDPPGGEPGSLEAQLRSMLLATKVHHSPLVQSDGRGCPEAPWATPATQDSSSSSCLFEAPLERPQWPRRLRCPQVETVSPGKEPDRAVDRKITPGSITGEPDDAQFTSAGPRSSQLGSGPSNLPIDPVGRGSQAMAPPRPLRVSFSRISAPGPLRPPAPSSPVNLPIPLSPGGRPVNRNIGEPVEFLYVDEDEGYSLVERHVPCTDDSLAGTTPEEDTLIYDWQAYTGPSGRPSDRGKSPPEGREATLEASALSGDTLPRKLQDLGVHPGPITEGTRKLYTDLRERLRRDPRTKAQKESAGYSPELSSALETSQIQDGTEDEMALAKQFDRPDQSQKWREGLLKSSFTYLLLDPRVTQNLPFRSRFVSRAECFRTFLRAIFYVGKGTRSRPYSHLYEALSHYKEPPSRQASAKVRHILDIWASGQGVISMHCFQNVIPVEAYTREACMVEALGLKRLTNQKKGNYYGVVAGWPMKRRRSLGVHLLHRAMKIFLAEGERQLRPADIQTG